MQKFHERTTKLGNQRTSQILSLPLDAHRVRDVLPSLSTGEISPRTIGELRMEGINAHLHGREFLIHGFHPRSPSRIIRSGNCVHARMDMVILVTSDSCPAVFMA